MWGHFGRGYECSEKVTPRLNKFGQDPQNVPAMTLANSANTEPNDTKYNKNLIYFAVGSQLLRGGRDLASCWALAGTEVRSL